MALQQYSPDRVKVTFAGFPLTGFMDGTFIEVERSEDAYTMQVGSLGDVTRTRNLNLTGKITLTLMQHAPANDFLFSLLITDDIVEQSPKPMQVKDLTNGMHCGASQAWIEKAPKIERGKESGSCQWVFGCADLEIGSTAV